MKIFPNGIKHEFARRYSFFDWYKSRKISKIIDIDCADDLVYKRISDGSSLLIGRLGASEARFIGAFLKKFSEENVEEFHFLGKLNEANLIKRKKEIQLNAGFFYSNRSDAYNFVKNYLNCLQNTDILGAWGYSFTWPETFALTNFNFKAINKEFTAPWVEPYCSSPKCVSRIPWSHILENKKVLVISPFSKSIVQQHSIIEKVFPNINYPKFTLNVINAPLTSGLADNSNHNWFDLLEKMKSEIKVIDFDIALVSAGSYSFPLAHFVKQIGKIGIHSGGGLQLFFGIMGNRWSKSPQILKYVNSYWTRPNSHETPKGANLIENGCYW